MPAMAYSPARIYTSIKATNVKYLAVFSTKLFTYFDCSLTQIPILFLAVFRSPRIIVFVRLLAELSLFSLRQNLLLGSLSGATKRQCDRFASQ